MAKVLDWDWRGSVPRHCIDFQCELRSLSRSVLLVSLIK